MKGEIPSFFISNYLTNNFIDYILLYKIKKGGLKIGYKQRKCT